MTSNTGLRMLRWKRRSNRPVQFVCLSLCAAAYLICSYLGMFDSNQNVIIGENAFEDKTLDGSRSLLVVLANCTPRAIEQFPRDIFTTEQRREGAIVVHILVTLYMFLGFALLCDDYFVPSLEVICEVLRIQSDVAGATFMAAGSSAPELATAIISVFIAKDDIGIGTVVGSAVYNVMFVISICALCAGMVVNLNWWPLFRDCLFYAISVTALALVMLDEEVYWYESVIFLALYLVYIVIMYFNVSLEMWIVPKFSCCCKVPSPAANLDVVMTLRHSTENGSTCPAAEQQIKESAFVGQALSDDSDFEDDTENTREPLIGNNASTSTDNTEQDDHTEPNSVLAFPTVWWKKVIWVLALPLKLVFFLTVPDCRKSRWRKFFMLTFFMSLVWLSTLSYLMVWMITIIGYTAGIADSIMGLTFIAFGVSLPDVISSLIVVREGLGDMAISNAIGSNVFDILICLGIPWFLQNLIKGAPVQVYSEGLLYATFTLLGTVLFLLVSTHINGWRLTKTYGIILMVVYILFTVLTSLYELNIFGYVHPQECASNF